MEQNLPAPQNIECKSLRGSEARATEAALNNKHHKILSVHDKIVQIILSYTDYIKRTVWNE